APSSQEDAGWSRRIKANVERLRTGDVTTVAGLVRDLMRRQEDTGLSLGEKDLLRDAKAPLVTEVAVVLGVDEPAAEATIDVAVLDGVVPTELAAAGCRASLASHVHHSPAGRARGPPHPVSDPVWRAPGMPLLLAMTALGFSGYAALLPVAPLWTVQGGADATGSGLVNGVLMLATVLTQVVVPTALRRLGWAPVLVAGMLFLGVPAALHGVSDALGPVLALSALRGVGFGVVTVTGSLLVA